MAQEFLTVSELNNLIQDIIRAGFPQPLWVCGEIQGYNRNRGKNHIFFDLVEKDEDSDDIIAKVGLVLFAGKKAHINETLKQSENAFLLKDDIEVKFACSVDYYPPHGALRLIVESIDPTYTLGRLAQEKQKLIALLKKEGVFDKNKALELPLAPLKIGLVTADDSAAYNDFCSELEKSGFGFHVCLRNTLMQGKKAEQDICRAIDVLSRRKELDVIVITRGGGSIADLSCFDSKLIARKIAGCALPVLSGIGHEINLTVTDLAAHTFAKTPTAVAKLLVDRVESYLEDLDELCEQVIEEATQLIDGQTQYLKGLASGLQNKTQAYLKDHNERLIRYGQVIRQGVPARVKIETQGLNDRKAKLLKAVEACLVGNRKTLSHYQKLVDIAHPDNTMKRGFTVTRGGDGRLIKSVKEVNIKDGLVTEFADGVAESSVSRVAKS